MAVSSGNGGKLVTVAVCVGSRGPYTFVVDTGSSKSVIDSGVALTLRLRRAGSTQIGGAGCATTGALVQLPKMKVGKVLIQPQTMIAAPLSNWGGRRVAGVLGSDVLGRFQAFKLDLVKHTLAVPGVEGPAPVTHGIVIGQPGGVPPPSLVPGKPVVDVPLTVVQGPGTYGVFANMAVAGKHPYSFVVDTGAPMSTIDTTAAYALKISNSGRGPAPAGIGCRGTVLTLEPAMLSIGTASSTLVTRSIHILGGQRIGIIGFLGLDFLGRAGAIVVDYAGAQLAFVAR